MSDTSHMTMGFLGSGRMAQALSNGFISAGESSSLIIAHLLFANLP